MAALAFIKKAAPWIGTAISLAVPGAAPIVGIASKLLSTGLGKDVPANPDKIADAIGTAMADPAQLAVIKKIDDDFAAQMRQMGIQEITDLEKVAASDRSDARAMQVATRSKVVPAIAIAFVVGFFLVTGLKLFHVITVSDQTVNDLITTLRDGLMLILAYYFGSSAGSDRKTELLAQAPAIDSK
jgi:hypothetical protein